MAAVGVGVVIADAQQPSQPILYCNPAFERLTGYAASEVLGRNCRFLQGRDTEPGARSEIRAALSQGRECSVVLKNYRKDGSAFWNDLTISPVRDQAGRISHFIGVQSDVTALRGAEEEKARLLVEVESAAARQWGFLKDILFGTTDGRLTLCDSPSELPEPLPQVQPSLPLTEANLRLIRNAVQNAARSQEIPEARWQDFQVAVGETGTNAITHARGGQAEVRAGDACVQVWVRDAGSGIPVAHIHKVMLMKGFTTAGTMGFGYFLTLKFCDRVYLLTGSSGTTVVLELHRTPPPPPWAALLL